MQTDDLDEQRVREFGRKLEEFAATLDDEEQEWLAALCQTAADAVGEAADVDGFSVSLGQSEFDSLPGTPQSNVQEGLLTGLGTPIDNPLPPAAAVGPAAMNFVLLSFGQPE